MNRPLLKSCRSPLYSGAILYWIVPFTASAHPGVHGAHPLVDGLVHPFTGLDHLAFLVCMGVVTGLALRRSWKTAIITVIGGLALHIVIHNLRFSGQESATAGFTTGLVLSSGLIAVASLAMSRATKIRPLSRVLRLGAVLAAVLAFVLS